MRVGRTAVASPRDGIPEDLRLSEVLAGLTSALDITEGQPVGHSVRSCMIGMRIAERAGMPEEERADLLYALLLKDLGCSSNAAKVCYLFGADDRKAKHDLKLARWTTFLGGAVYAARHVVPHGSTWEKLRKFVNLGIEGAGCVCPEAFEALKCRLANENALAPESFASARHRGETDRIEWLDATRTIRPPAPSIA
ncbi:MAG: hypothetical protein ACR2GQ_00635 [Gemmatimonadota bacterium]